MAVRSIIPLALQKTKLTKLCHTTKGEKRGRETMVEYYLRIYIEDVPHEDEYGPYSQNDFLATIAGIQHKMRSGEIKVRARTNWPNNPESNQEWWADVEYITTIQELLPKNEHNPQPEKPMPPRPNPYPPIDHDKVEMHTVTYADADIKATSAVMKAMENKWDEEESEDGNYRFEKTLPDPEFPLRLLNQTPEDEGAPVEEWEEELLRYNSHPKIKELADEDEEEYDEDDEDITEEDDGSPKWVLDKRKFRNDLLTLLDDRMSSLFSLVTGTDPIEDANDYPRYNNDGIEMAILDGYLTYDEVVEKFSAKLRSYLGGAASATDRNFSEALNRTQADLEIARPNPSSLQNFDVSEDDLPPASVNDQSWVDYVPESFREEKNQW